MPVVTSYPGVYLEEIPSTTRTVTSVSTAATAFADFFPRGPVGEAVRVTSFRELTRIFGGLDTRSEASYGLYQYFNNGGSAAWVVRAIDQAAAQATLAVEVLMPTLAETAAAAENAATAARAAATEAAEAAGEATGSGDAILNVSEVAKQTQLAADATQSVADQAMKAAENLSGNDAKTMKKAAQGASDAAAKARVAAEETSDAVTATEGAADEDSLQRLLEDAVKAAQDAAAAAKDADAQSQAVVATLPDDLGDDVAKPIKDAAGEATAAADAAQTAAEAAAPSSDDSGGDDTSGDQPTAAAKASGGASEPTDEEAAAAAKTLSDQVASVASSTSQAATSTSDASAAAAQASQELQIAIDVAGASSGAAATEAQTAAIAAAQAADAAATAAEEAQAAAEAARDVDASDPASRDVVRRAVAAAEAAAEAAQKASQQAAAAQQAADAVAAAGQPVSLQVSAANPGAWGNQLRVSIQRSPVTKGASSTTSSPQFQLDVEQLAVVGGKKKVVAQESYLNLSLDEGATRYAPHTVNQSSTLIRLEYVGEHVPGSYPADTDKKMLGGGADGGLPDAATLIDTLETALDRIAPDIFNILCLPLTARYSVPEANTAYSQALQYCEKRRAFLIVDPPPAVRTVAQVKQWSEGLRSAESYSGAVYFPRLVIPDPLREYRPREVGPSGTVAGIYSRTDVARGVWKAPAGIEAVIDGADLSVKLTDDDSGLLNPLGINVLRSFPVYGNVVWGARTLAGADLLQSEWKYVNVRRLTDFIEESLFQSLKWVVFEPNEELTWSQIRLQVNTFLAGLFAGGAFQGDTPDQAFFVHVDATTTTATDIANGVVNIVVGFAPAKPAEFVILQIEQIAGQTAA